MSTQVVISCWLKALTCIAFALALVFSPPSAAHAASGMHDTHQAKSVSPSDTAASHDEGDDAHDAHIVRKIVSDISTAMSDKGDRKQQFDECCNGICISVVLLEDSKVCPERVGAKVYVILDGFTHSVETSEFLRPPRFLI